MVIRLFLLFGIVLLGGTGWFIVGSQPPTVQDVPVVSEVTRLQAEGIIPSGDLEENPAVEEGVFTTPAEDETHLAEAMSGMANMPGMNMGTDGGMDMSADGGMDMSASDGMDMQGAAEDDSGQVLDMDMNGDGIMDMSSAAMQAQSGMDMGNGASSEGQSEMDMAGGGMDMQGAAGDGSGQVLDMDMNGDGIMDMSSAAMQAQSGMDMGTDGTMNMAGNSVEPAMDEEEAAKAMNQQMAGLLISDDGAYDREVTFSMSEWTFSDLNIEVKQGERIKFTMRNDGTLLHEFMFMTMAEMQAIDYRAKRADWNLYEHEALFEKSLLLPGQEITFVAEITKPGSWMFMCMLPYHMQLGMMGQIATQGRAMKM
jgi:uncharacterized cupredoxin-like copper-binding protein